MVELPADGLNALLSDVHERLSEVVTSPEKLRDLLRATLVVGAGLELDPTLQRIVQAATQLLGARYGALGVRAPGGGLSEFVYEGIDAGERATMGHLPEGRGLLGLLIDDPRPVRIRELDRHAASVGFPPNHPPMSSFLGVPIIVRGRAFGSIYLTEKRDAPEFTDEDEVILTVLAESAALAVDNARLFEESRTRERWLRAVAAINSSLLIGGSVPETLDLLVRRVRELTSAESVTLLDASSGRAIVAATTDHPRDNLVADLAGSPVEEALRTGRAQLTEPGSGSGPAAVLPVSGPQHIEGALVVALGAGAHPWKPDELSRLASMADLAAVALEFAHRQRQQRLLDVLADRDRIARDLHDNVIQRLFATGMSLQSIALPAPDGEVLARSVEQLDRTVREIRTTIFDLQTGDTATPASLRRRLLDVIGEVTPQSAITPTVQFSGPIDTLVPAPVHPHAEAVLREGLSNARRHASASSIAVSITAAEEFTIAITDDGVGMSGDEPRSGLANLDRRAATCAGRCEVTAAVGGGTVLTWRVPMGAAG
ncbi:GAF domain-containing protein [Rhodococcus maanshanensis]|uniref:GAF domain-containing sensor histidine kinase n=1 Tax=Rhodococcus maanshanensis TaxID=183556 RepID=UPI0022B541F9|nr:GAF domain-containing protein [Rhodococcus maanshanensis]MCZ4556135.1 GAF domain-containing protein [Rhodococcus maanshanensis]